MKNLVNIAEETHIGTVTRVVDTNLNEKARGAVYFKSLTLSGDSEYPIAAEPNFPLAGKDSEGFFWVPQVGDLIEVKIKATSTNQNPTYTRMFYSDDNEIHELFSGSYPFGKGWATRSGHILFFNDKPKEERVLLSSSQGHQVLLDDKPGKEKIFIVHKNGSQIQMTEDGSIRIISVANKKATVIALSGKDGSVIVTSQKGAVIAMTDKIAISDSKGEARVELGDGKVQVTAKKSVVINSPSVNSKCGVHNLGSEPLFSAVCGENLITYNDTHTHTCAVGPTSPPVVPMASFTGSPLSIITPWVKVQKPL